MIYFHICNVEKSYVKQKKVNIDLLLDAQIIRKEESQENFPGQ